MRGGAEPQANEDSIITEAENQQINSFFLLSAYKKTLHNIGLSLEPVSGGATIINESGSANQGQMMINVSSKDHFTSFLGALESEQIETSGLKGIFKKSTDTFSANLETI